MQESLFEVPPVHLYQFEEQARLSGYLFIAGVDEAGRGPLAGPVVAAAVILRQDHPINGVNDSKKLTALKRELLYDKIVNYALSVGIGSVSPETIDQINILQATRQAMLDAVNQLCPQPDCLLIDGITPIATSLRQQTIKQGDGRSASIAAASIIAKVTRDRIMADYDSVFPQYGFGKHKGYGTAEHLEALKKHGVSPIHRKTFAPVRQLCSVD